MQLALERCPKSDDVVVEARRAIKREIFCQGYAAAENALALTWEDILEIGFIADKLDAEGIVIDMTQREYCEEVLKRFNEQREKK